MFSRVGVGRVKKKMKIKEFVCKIVHDPISLDRWDLSNALVCSHRPITCLLCVEQGKTN